MRFKTKLFRYPGTGGWTFAPVPSRYAPPASHAKSDQADIDRPTMVFVEQVLLGCCQLAEVHPVEYLADVMPRVTRRLRIADLPTLLPAQWKPTRSVAS